ncbi:MAG: single-stranded DNA-binding protein [Oscillospiraceae bacterium]|nr:single-stranded DNA-binding protein [Oscillospiraceae bacterium]
MLNHIVIMGRLTWDPELRYTQSQVPVASFRVAVDRDYSGRDGGEKQADFIDCVAWRSTAEFVSKYFSKGSMIVVSGHLQIRNWTDKENNRRTSAEVVAENIYFGESRRRDGDGYRGGNDSYRGNDGYRNNDGYRGNSDNYRGGDSYRGNSDNARGGNDGYRSGGNDSYRGGNSDGGYRGGNDSYSGGSDSFRSFDDSSAGSGFTELSDTDGELPF